ncbi:MAG: transcription termination factor Rho [Bowdeniella nasicola]|nr:transcription termination factor Rho [Bowdeniella nasicola]
MSEKSDAAPKSRPLSAKRLSELQEIATQLGIDTTKKRRPELIKEIRAARTAANEGASKTSGKKTTNTGKKRQEAPAADKAREEQSGTEKSRDEKSRDDRDNARNDSKRSGQRARQRHDERQSRDDKGSDDKKREKDQSRKGDNVPTLEELEEAAAKKRERRNEHNDERDDRRRNRNDRNRNNRRRNRHDRNRDRGNRRRGRDDDHGPEIREDDVLIPVAGILDVLDNYAFVRTTGYLPGENDVYVTLGQVKKYGMRRGDAVVGKIRQPREDDRRSQRQKYNPLVSVDSVNGRSVDQAKDRPHFGKLTPLYPNEMLRLETTAKAITPRIIDLVAPIGKGQRGLIVSPPKAGKTMMMQQIANSITANNPNVYLMVVLVDERPEEVTDMQRMVEGEVIASTFDRPASDHTIVAELAIERAKRLVEMGRDVVVLLDSLTRLSRAYNLAAPASGRILSGGVDASALYPPKKFFGAARNIENGGSLTILASALVETGSKMDEVIFEEFKGTGNSEIRLSRQLADKRIFPAVDVNASGTRREELLVESQALQVMWRLRRLIAGLEKEQALELMLKRLRETQNNAEFLMSIVKTTPANRDEAHAGEFA